METSFWHSLHFQGESYITVWETGLAHIWHSCRGSFISGFGGWLIREQAECGDFCQQRKLSEHTVNTGVLLWWAYAQSGEKFCAHHKHRGLCCQNPDELMQYCTLSWNQKCAKHSCLSDTPIEIQITINQTSIYNYWYWSILLDELDELYMKSECEHIWFLFGQKCVNVAGVAHQFKGWPKKPILHNLQPIKAAVKSSVADLFATTSYPRAINRWLGSGRTIKRSKTGFLKVPPETYWASLSLCHLTPL